MNVIALILAAGMGTRMGLAKPKVLAEIAGLPLINHLEKSLIHSDINQIYLIYGPELAEYPLDIQAQDRFMQTDRLGTAHAVSMANPLFETLDDHDIVFVTYGDTPLIRPETYQNMLFQFNEDPNVTISVLGFESDLESDENHYGRLIVDQNDRLTGIREYLDCSEVEKRIRLSNSGVMALRAKMLKTYLSLINNQNQKGEFYLTDIIQLVVNDGHKVSYVICEEDEALGINCMEELHEAEQIFQYRMREDALANAVHMMDADTVYFHHDTKIAKGVTLEPNIFFGPEVIIEAGAKIRAFSHIEGAHIQENAVIGPFARLRPGTVIDSDVKIGNFVEIKNSHLQAGSKASHLSYIGDCEVGEKANIGAGTITCNYDGKKKSKTKIGEEAFIGSNTSLVAPVEVGDGAMVGAGSVITKDVPKKSLALSRTKQENKVDWFTKLENRQRKEKA